MGNKRQSEAVNLNRKRLMAVIKFRGDIKDYTMIDMPRVPSISAALYIAGLAQDCDNFSALAIEIPEYFVKL